MSKRNPCPRLGVLATLLLALPAGAAPPPAPWLTMEVGTPAPPSPGPRMLTRPASGTSPAAAS
jgi:hypothetical protein